MIDKLLSAVDWNSSETGEKVRKVERAFYVVLRRKLSPVEFIQKVCGNDFLAAAICLVKIINSVSGFDDLRCREIITDNVRTIIHFGEHSIEEYASCCLASLVLKEYSLVEDIFFVCSNLDEADQENILKATACRLDMAGTGPENFSPFLSMVYANFSREVSGKIMEMFPFQLQLGNSYDNPCFEKLINQAVEDSDYHGLYWLTEIFTDLNFERAHIDDSEQFIQKVVEEDDYLGYHVLLKWLTRSSGSFNEGIDRLWPYLQKGSGENAGWMSFYCLSQAVIHGEDPDAAVEKYGPLPYCGTMDQIHMDKAGEAIAMAVDCMIENSSLKTAAYLKKINDYNIFKFADAAEDTIRVREVKRNRSNYCSSMVESGLPAEEIIFIYMNSHLRRFYDFYTMVCGLCDSEEYRRMEGCNLYDLFKEYPLKGKCVFKNSRLYVKFDSVCCGYLAQANSKWLKNNMDYITNGLSDGMEIAARVSFYFRSRKALTVENITATENGDLTLWRQPAYEHLKNLLAEVLECRDFTEVHRIMLGSLKMVDIDECGRSAEAALYILDICCELSYDFSKVQSFLQAVNSCFDGDLNKFRHIDFASKMEEVPKEDYVAMLPHVYEAWNVLKQSRLKPEELVHIYSNTILKRVIIMENLVRACFDIPYNDEFIDISSVFEDRWYSGRMVFYNEKTLAIRPEVFNKGKAFYNYYFDEEGPEERYGTGQMLYFWLKEYNPIKHQFVIGEFSTRKTMHKKEPTRYFIKTILETTEVANENIADYKKKALASSLVAIEPVHLPGLIAKLDKAVRFRRKSTQDIIDYFNLLGDNNVFRLSDGPLYELEYTSKTKEYKSKLLFEILCSATLDDGLYIFLNTYFKYYMGLDEFFGLYYEANTRKEFEGRNIEEYNIRFAGYPIICGKGSTSNIKCGRFLIDGEPADNKKDYRLIITGYQKDAGCALFSDMDTVFGR